MEQLLEHAVGREPWLGPHAGHCAGRRRSRSMSLPGAGWGGRGSARCGTRVGHLQPAWHPCSVCSLANEPCSPPFKFRADQLRQVISGLGLLLHISMCPDIPALSSVSPCKHAPCLLFITLEIERH